jgi:hypothetical protein
MITDGNPTCVVSLDGDALCNLIARHLREQYGLDVNACDVTFFDGDDEITVDRVDVATTLKSGLVPKGPPTR